MKRKLIFGAAGLVIITAIFIIVRVCSVRSARVAACEARLNTLIWTHRNLKERGPEYALIHAELNIIGNSRALERLLSHPLAWLWARPLSGAYEEAPLRDQPTRQDWITGLRAHRLAFQTTIGVTNKQQEIALSDRMLEIMKESK